MAGLFFIFMFLAFPRRLLGFDRGSPILDPFASI